MYEKKIPVKIKKNIRYPTIRAKIPNPQKVEVTNFPKLSEKEVKFPRVQEVRIINHPTPVLPKEIKFPEIQKVEVTNKTDIQDVKITNAQKLPLGKGNIPGKADPEEYINVRLTNGKRFYQALEDAYVSASKPGSSSGGGGGTVGGSTEATLLNLYSVMKWFPNDSIQSGSITYLGDEDKDGAYLITKIDTSSGNVTRYASITNNPSVTTYADAWTARASLTYGYYSQAQ